MSQRFLLAVVGVCCAAECFSPRVWANPPRVVPDEVVFPTGEFPTDVENVQAAVDQGGIVLLKATNQDGQPTAFNFGPPDPFVFGSVALETDVWVLGETAGSQMTTIEGGVFPLFGRAGRVRIEGIHFHGALVSAIIVVQSTGAEVVGNRITGVVPLPPEFGFTEARAIKFLANAFPITGTVVVADNLIEDSVPADYSDDVIDFSDGIVFDEVEADVYIEGNTIADVQDDGILMINSRGPVHIRDNLIVPGPGEPGSFGNGIAINHGTAVDTSNASFEITGNDVFCENPNADGMYLFGNRATIISPVVARNRVTMQGSFFGAITLYGNVSSARVSNNRIDGEGAFAFDVVSIRPGDAAESNRFQGNNISHFDASVADLFLDAHTRDTTFSGQSGTVIDLGTGNRISGVPKE